MEKIIKRRGEERRRVINSIREWARKLDFKATVMLIGSYARGDFNLWSDIDILLIAKTDKPVHRRLEELDYPAGTEIIFLTPEEFKELLKKKEKYVLEALRDGIILRDDYDLTTSLEKY